MRYTIYGSELRIGNWIQDRMGRPYQILGILSGCRILFGPGTDKERQTDDALPIELTPEILEKAGFEHHYYKAEDEAETDSEWWTIRAGKGLWGKNEITIVKFDEGLKYSCHDTRAECKYVHQLQNLYFALTGEELSIQF